MSTGRKYLTKKERADMLAAQGGVCITEGCGSTGPLVGEHSDPNYYKPGKPDSLMCVACHKEKTRRDKKAIGKTKRLNGETPSQYARRQMFGPTFKSRNTFENRRGMK